MPYEGLNKSTTLKPFELQSVKELLSAFSGTVEGYYELPSGVFDLGSDFLTPTIPNSRSLILVGKGISTLIKGAGTRVIDFGNSSWGDTVKDFQLRNVKIEHDCSNADDVTLDLSYVHHNLDRVWCTQTNSTHNGIPIKTGPTGCAGFTNAIKESSCYGYDTGPYLECDHTRLSNYIVNESASYGFRLGHCLDFIGLMPQVKTTEIAQANTCKAYKLEHSVGLTQLYGPSLEMGGTAQSQVMFSRTDSDGLAWDVFNPALDSLATVITRALLSDTYDRARIRFHGSTSKIQIDGYYSAADFATFAGDANICYQEGCKFTVHETTGHTTRIYTRDDNGWKYATTA